MFLFIEICILKRAAGRKAHVESAEHIPLGRICEYVHITCAAQITYQ